MRKRKNYSLVFFITHIPLLVEEGRSFWLHLIADRFRKDYGLYGATLLQSVMEVNAMKCMPPLEDGEVEDIVRLVDEDNTPLGTFRLSAKQTARSKKDR